MKPVIIMAKSAPRQYTSPTMPTCQIEVTVNVLARADLDWNGMKYLDVISKTTQALEQWQKCLQDTHEDFSFEGEFRCVGFQLGAGSYSFDPQDKTWQYVHSMTVFGVTLAAPDGDPGC